MGIPRRRHQSAKEDPMPSEPRRVRTPAPLPGFPARQIIIPAGGVLTDDEIITLVSLADERKRRGESWLSVEDLGPEGFRIVVPKSAAITRQEAIVILSRANEAREYVNADFAITFQD